MKPVPHRCPSQTRLVKHRDRTGRSDQPHRASQQHQVLSLAVIRREPLANRARLGSSPPARLSRRSRELSSGVAAWSANPSFDIGITTAGLYTRSVALGTEGPPGFLSSPRLGGPLDRRVSQGPEMSAPRDRHNFWRARTNNGRRGVCPGRQTPRCPRRPTSGPSVTPETLKRVESCLNVAQARAAASSRSSLEVRACHAPPRRAHRGPQSDGSDCGPHPPASPTFGVTRIYTRRSLASEHI